MAPRRLGFIERPVVMIAVLLLSAEIIAAWLVLGRVLLARLD
jgi:hypothetical protein